VCPNCNFGFVDEYIDQQKIDLFYTEQYRERGSNYRKKATFLPVIPIRAISQWTLVNLFYSFDDVGNILDIGTGYGYTFDVARKIFKRRKSYYAFEPDKHTQNYLIKKGVNIYGDIFNKNTNVKEKFDIVIMSHVLEHYNGCDVVPILRNIQNILTDNGIALIEVPNDNIEKIKTMRKNDAPHLSFFSIDALNSAIKNAGMNLLYINTCGKLQSEYYSNKSCNNKFFNRIFRKCGQLINKMEKYLKYDLMSILSYNQYYRYGGDRIWIRAVVSKSVS
jgi:SAM-dependent methyltransferase